jgi:RNA polymerase sigma-70 factor (ECF subfamily)
MEKAFDILAAQFRPMLLTYLRALTAGDEHASEDLAQETLLAAYRGLDGFRTDGDFGAWLRGIARNKALERRRVESRRKWVADSTVLDGMEDVFALFDRPRSDGGAWSDRLEQVRECLRRLTGPLRDAVGQVYTEGRSLREAAAALGATPAAVGQRLSRAREAIRRCVEDKQDTTGGAA